MDIKRGAQAVGIGIGVGLFGIGVNHAITAETDPVSDKDRMVDIESCATYLKGQDKSEIPDACQSYEFPYKEVTVSNYVPGTPTDVVGSTSEETKRVYSLPTADEFIQDQQAWFPSYEEDRKSSERIKNMGDFLYAGAGLLAVVLFYRALGQKKAFQAQKATRQ